ncbi:serine/threonine-protein phosphatase 2A 56 kDa regulatory subunit delta isoform [Coemansia asiatica]|uniref:Serine/threonine-protein phosphatase 2A 56 kDa regulatory subunit delta isoform n=1 Tax=Coemansia asiatica TaxID=1052880 RepID=A0A9W7XES5_9FUNG|nr:serine/threonine-protein phosphatase 2A 56 kDa regulatory subunit delta isoform [Coemansia asiatica]
MHTSIFAKLPSSTSPASSSCDIALLASSEPLENDNDNNNTDIDNGNGNYNYKNEHKNDNAATTSLSGISSLLGEGLTDAERKELLSQKLVQCTVVFDFQNPNENIEAKEAKQRTLGEILDYMSERTGVITLDIYPKLFKMVSANLFRTIPPQINAFGDPFDPEEDEPRDEPAWPHLCLVYHIFLRFLESSDFNNSAARPYIDQSFTTQLLELFDCEDVHERESLKTVLHRIYGKMLSMRSFIRRSINNIFLQFIYETHRHNGIAELLEILGSIINGFTVPLKDEHVNFLHRVLLPLHKARPMTLYYAQLAYCTVQFIEKDPTLAETIVKSLLRYWPKVNSPKEVMFVNELESIMDVIEPAQFTNICQPLFQQLVKCIVSPHFQIAERTLGMWRNNYFVNLITDNISLILPIALSGIYRHSRTHWNRNIHNQVYQILRFFVNINEELFEQCLSDFRHQRDMERKQSKKTVDLWSTVERIATEKIASGPMTPATGTMASTDTVATDQQQQQQQQHQSHRSLPESPVTAASAVAAADTAAGSETPDDSADAESPINNNNNGEAHLATLGAADEAAGDADARAGADSDADRWGRLPTELPMSKLDDPDMMCIEMDEDEFIRELDKFVDIIKAEDPETAMNNGMMLLDESDGSAIVDEVLGAAGQGAYAYSQQLQNQHDQQHHQQQQYYDHQQHAALLHGMVNGTNGEHHMDSHMAMDPANMHVDYAGSMVSAEMPISIPPTMMHTSMAPSETYHHNHHNHHQHQQHQQQQRYIGHGGIGSPPSDMQMASIALHRDASAVSDEPSAEGSISPVAIVSPVPGSGIAAGADSEGDLGPDQGGDTPPNSTSRMEVSSTPPPQHSS